MTSVVAFAPGRVNLFGEHTDYNQGLALPFAIQEGVTVQATATPDRRIEVTAVDLGESDSFELGEAARADGWRTFVRGSVAELRRAGVKLSGTRLRISGTVPRGAGLASSAALEVATALALTACADASQIERTELAKLCSRVENEWVGAQTGLLDQLASLYGEPDHALRIDFRSLEVTPVPLELDGHRLMTLDSGEQHTNSASGYNQRRAECARACELLGIESLRDATLAQAARLPDPLDRRVRHVINSNGRVEEAVAALRDRDFERLGALLDLSHASLRDVYEVSTPRVEEAIGRLKDAGALGARIMGGGFGGCVLGLFAPGDRPPKAAVEVRPGQGARLLSAGE